MTSTRKRDANRKNAQKSTGPTSSTGKARASQNAFRHGLGAFEQVGGADDTEVRKIADALCQPYLKSAAMSEQAIIIAEAQIQIRRVRAARTALIERKRNRQRASILGYADNEFEFELAKLSYARPDKTGRMILRAVRRLQKFVEEINTWAKGGAAIGSSELPKCLHRPNYLRDDASAVSAALPDLLGLERYERRALSRRRRAINTLAALAGTQCE